MKVPHSVVGRTRPSQEPFGYQSDALARGIASIEQIGNTMLAVDEAWRERQLKTQRFAEEVKFSSFETERNIWLAEQKRDSAPNDANFLKRISAAYDDDARKFLATMSPEMQQEYQVKVAELRGRVIANALDFQYKAQDAFYTQAIDQEFQKALTNVDAALGGDPANLAAEKERIFALIEKSDLSEGQKFEARQRISVGMELAVYKQEAKRVAAAGGGSHRLDPGIGAIIDQAAARHGIDPNVGRTIAWLESKGNPNARNPNSSAGGLFQQIDSNAAQYGVTNRFDPAQSAEGAMKFAAENRRHLMSVLGREPTAGEYYLAHQQGPAGAAALLANPNALAVDVVGYDAVRLNGGAPGMTAQQFANLWIDKANAVAGDTLDEDTRFSSLPYEDRIAAREDAEREALQDSNEAALAAKNTYNSRFNALRLDLMDGKQGQIGIDQARQEWLTDAGDIAQLQNILKDVTATQQLIAQGEAKLANNHPWNYFDEDDKKRSNALFNQRGYAAFTNNDEGYVMNELLPQVQRSQMIPPDAVGLLENMARSNNPQRMLYAYNTLSSIKGAAPEAFNRQVPDAVADMVQFWEDRKDSMPAEELTERLKGGRDQASRQETLILRDEANDYLTAKVNGVTQLRTAVSDVVSAAGGWGFDPAQSSIPWAARGLERDLRVAFVDAYEKYADVDQAMEAAKKKVSRVWTVSEIGGAPTLMKFAPEKLYPKVLGGYEWIERQVREEVPELAEGRFQLLSDAQTEDEYLRMQRGGAAPSYGLIRYDADGVPHVVMDDRPGQEGKPRRIWFEPTAEDRAREEQLFQFQRAERELNDFRIRNGVQGVLSTPPSEEVKEELRQEEERLRERMEMLRPPEEPLEVPAATTPQERSMDSFLFGNPLTGQ